jgi:universal stress protein family protein
MKLLLAVDGSKYSDAAVQTLVSKIRKEDTEVLVLQMVEPRIFSTPPQMTAGYEPELAELMEKQFEEAQQTVERAPPPSRLPVSKPRRASSRRKHVLGSWTWQASGTPI